MLLKSHLAIKCHSKYIKIIRLLQYISDKSNVGDRECIVLDMETIIVLVLLAFHLIKYVNDIASHRVRSHPPKVILNHGGLTVQGLCYYNSKALGRHNSYQRGVIGITDQFILQKVKKLGGLQQ